MHKYFVFFLIGLVLSVIYCATFYTGVGYTLIVIGVCIILFSKRRLDDPEYTQTESRKLPVQNFVSHAGATNGSGFWNESSNRLINPNRNVQFLSDNRSYSASSKVNNIPIDMWQNASPSHGRGGSRINRWDSPGPMLARSPIVTRQRNGTNGLANRSLVYSPSVTPNNASFTGPQGQSSPLLSSPFMPQIKRALGLEPNTQSKYREPKRYSFGLGGCVSPANTTSPGALPHVKLNSSKRPLLTERQMNKPSTVKIAPPVRGKIQSPSLYQMRNLAIQQEDRSTPDTHAVITALKERRKRSINTSENNSEAPTQQAKRRRQESQHSNASTSSMPSMPDNLPDLTSTDFSMRLETPALKRPSRPSRDDSGEWETQGSGKRARNVSNANNEGKNNSILSSLSSSQRYIAHMMTKRKADTSITENDSFTLKYQRNEPPKLTHLDISYDTVTSPKTPASTNGTPSAVKRSENNNSRQEQTTNGTPVKESPKTVDYSKPPGLKNIPSMKKTASIYGCLSSPGSFKKAQYANVVATLDDYDADREAEQDRVKQMLQDLDDTFSEEEAKKLSSAAVTTATLTLTTSIPSLATTTVTTSSTPSTASSTASVLSALGKLAKPAATITGDKTATSPATSTSQALPSFKPLFGSKTTAGSPPAASTSTGITLPTLSTSPVTAGLGGEAIPKSAPFSVGTSSATQASTGFTATPTSIPGLISSIGSNPPGIPGLSSSTALSQAATANLAGSTQGQAAPASTGGFSFGQNVKPSAPPPSYSATVGAKPVVTGPTGGFATVGVKPVVTGPTGGFNFGGAGASVAPSAAAALSGITGIAGINGPAPIAASLATSSAVPAQASVGGFNFGTAPVNPGQPQLKTPTISSPPPAYGGLATPSNPVTGAIPSGGLSFGGGSTAVSATGLQSTGGFSAGSAHTAATTYASGAAPFQFGVAAKKSTPASVSTGGFTGFAGTSVGSTATAASSMPAPSFQFGAALSQASNLTSPTNTGLLSTGLATAVKAAPSAQVAPFQFGSQPVTQASTATAPGGFSFNQTASTGAVPGFSFGATTTASAAPTAFGVQPANPVASPFGGISGLGSGGASQTPFGVTSTASNPSTAGGFAFGGGAKTTAAAAPSVQSAPFSFNAPGASTASTASANPFGTQPASTAPAPSGVFAFGQSQGTNQASTADAGKFNFGNAATATTTQAPSMFGTTTNQAPAFGLATNQQQPTAFGATANQMTAFGSTNQTTAFGAGTSNQVSAFGATATPFGVDTSGQKSNTPVFGASTNTGAGSMFGNAGAATTGFAKSQSMPVFGTTSAENNQMGGFNFGAGTSNGAPAFGQGQTTPAKQVGNAFGQASTNQTPNNQTGGVFQFGQMPSNSNGSASAVKGFDFSTSSGNMAAPNAGAFNFSSTPTAGAFGTPGSTPGAFTVGKADSTPRPPRAIARPNRRRPVRR